MSDGGSLSDAEFDVIDAINGNDAENNNLIPVNFQFFQKLISTKI